MSILLELLLAESTVACPVPLIFLWFLPNWFLPLEIGYVYCLFADSK